MDYNKLLEKARKVYAECVTNAEKRKLESVFPELAESEDEKIRKEILEYINKATGCKDWIAWLEKQGEQKSVLPGFEEQEGVAGRDYIPVEWVEAIENYGKWKIVKVNEQKPAWSEENEDAIGMAIEALEDLCDVDYPTDSFIGHNLSFYEAVERLKCLKPQPHWKPTEEQIEAVKRAAKDVFEFSSRSKNLRLKNEPYFKSLYSLYEQLKKL